MTEHTPEAPQTTSLSASSGTGTASSQLPVADDLWDERGDAACWAHRVCSGCGRLNDAERPVTCEACGAEFG
jgi:hypothetical protein